MFRSLARFRYVSRNCCVFPRLSIQNVTFSTVSVSISQPDIDFFEKIKTAPSTSELFAMLMSYNKEIDIDSIIEIWLRFGRRKKKIKIRNENSQFLIKLTTPHIHTLTPYQSSLILESFSIIYSSLLLPEARIEPFRKSIVQQFILRLNQATLHEVVKVLHALPKFGDEIGMEFNLLCFYLNAQKLENLSVREIEKILESMKKAGVNSHLLVSIKPLITNAYQQQLFNDLSEIIQIESRIDQPKIDKKLLSSRIKTAKTLKDLETLILVHLSQFDEIHCGILFYRLVGLFHQYKKEDEMEEARKEFSLTDPKWNIFIRMTHKSINQMNFETCCIVLSALRHLKSFTTTVANRAILLSLVKPLVKRIVEFSSSNNPDSLHISNEKYCTVLLTLASLESAECSNEFKKIVQFLILSPSKQFNSQSLINFLKAVFYWRKIDPSLFEELQFAQIGNTLLKNLQISKFQNKDDLMKAISMLYKLPLDETDRSKLKFLYRKVNKYQKNEGFK